MKKLFYVSLVSILFLASCGGNGKEEKQKDAGTDLQETLKSEEFDKAKSCDEFIDQYEKWMDDYLVLLEKYMKNPMDQALMEQYMKVSQEAMSWVEQWANLGVCVGNEKYQKRFDEIAGKAEKKMEELGLN